MTKTLTKPTIAVARKILSDDEPECLPAGAVSRFFSIFRRSVQDATGCLLWGGRRNAAGYGLFDLQKRPRLAHRMSFWLHTRILPRGFSVLHRCDNPACVNPSHLFLGTHEDNMKDMVAKGRQVKGPSHSCTMRMAAARGDKHGSVTKPDSVRRGAKAAGARLTEREVVSIRERYTKGGVLQRQLAAEYGVNQSQISDVITHTTWSHI